MDYAFLAHPAFRPKMSLCHRAASVVCPQFTKNASPPSILIRFRFCLVYLMEIVPVHRTASPILEILICNQLALTKDEFLCH